MGVFVVYMHSCLKLLDWQLNVSLNMQTHCFAVSGDGCGAVYVACSACDMLKRVLGPSLLYPVVHMCCDWIVSCSRLTGLNRPGAARPEKGCVVVSECPNVG